MLRRRFVVAEAAELLDFPPTLFMSGKDYAKDPLDLLHYRAKVADAVEKLLAH